MKLRLLLAIVLLGGLFYYVGAGELLAVFQKIEPLYLVYLLLLTVIMIWASCLKWRLFLRASGHEVPMLHLMNLYTVGYFFNTFTPSYVGGDIARSFHLGRYLKSQRDAFVSTFLERFTGLLAMSILGVLFVVLGAEATAGLSAAILSVGALALLLACACFCEPFGQWCFSLLRRVLRCFDKWTAVQKVLGLMEKVNDGMSFARSNPKLLLNALWLSLFFHFLTVVNTYVAARAIGWHDPSIGGLFIVVPLVLLISMAPLTPSGLGLQEGAFLFLLQRVGASHAQGLGVGLVLRAKVMLVAVLGGMLWLRIRKQTPEEE